MPSVRRRHARPEKKGSLPELAKGPRELKIALLCALPFGAAAAVMLNWDTLFPVAPDRLVKVGWTHECGCANGWIQTLRAEGFVVHDYELDDLRSVRQQWRVPDALHGCHPANYMGYALEGHVAAESLRRLARERPNAVGLDKRDTVEPDAHGQARIVSSELLLIDSKGTAREWR